MWTGLSSHGAYTPNIVILKLGMVLRPCDLVRVAVLLVRFALFLTTASALVVVPPRTQLSQTTLIGRQSVEEEHVLLA